MYLNDFLPLLQKVKGHGNQYSACCPAHGDKRASLSVKETDQGVILLNCHAGCSTEAITNALGLTMGDLFPSKDEKNVRKQPIAVYPYKDESGNLLAEKLRYPDKSFTWRRPDGKGSWVYNRQGVPNVLYNLPAIKEQGTVYIVEGEKDVDTLTKCGLTAVCGAMGAGKGKWLDEYTSQLKDRCVIVIPDNDPIGMEFSVETANALAKAGISVRLLDLKELWPEIPVHGDITDLYEEYGLDGVKNVDKIAGGMEEYKITNSTNSTNSIGYPFLKPIPFDRPYNLPYFPKDVFIQPVDDYINGISEDVQVSTDMIATSVLALTALCAQRKFLIEAKPGWREPINLFAAVVAPPAERKSAIADRLLKPVLEFEIEESIRIQPAIDYYLADKKILEGKVKALEEMAIKNKATVEEVAEARSELSNLKEVKPVRLWTDNATTEAITSLLADYEGNMSVISAEGGIFNIMAGRYSNDVDIDVFLKGHAGDAIRIDRKGRPTEFIPHPALTMLLFIQPVVLDGIMSNDAFKGRGLLARFLFSMPNSKVGTRKYETNSIPREVEESFNNLLMDILRIPVPKEENIITLSQEAYNLARDFFYEIEPRLRGDLEPLGDWAGKLHGTTMRIAALLHILEYKEHSHGYTITGETMEKAIKIGKYYLEHAQAAYLMMGADKAIADAKYILRMLEKNKSTEITRTELTRLCRGKFEKAEDMEPAIEELVVKNYLIKGETEVKANNRKQVIYIVNPQIYIVK